MDFRCGSCIFWMHMTRAQRADGASVGQCRRHAPVTMCVQDKVVSRWPLVGDTDGCGEHSVLAGQD